MNLIDYLKPWEFSPTIALISLGLAGIYVRGLIIKKCQQQTISLFSQLNFWLGLISAYAVVQTQYDYYAQHMFWIHQTQHFILHYLSPFFLILAYPGSVLMAGLPKFISQFFIKISYQNGFKKMYNMLVHPIMTPIMFVGFTFFWLQPDIHFISMLSYKIYQLMNACMWLDGLLFWLLIFNNNPFKKSLSIKKRLLILWWIMPPQIVLGAYIALSRKELYVIYDICGRAWPEDALIDQHYAGLITWIPASIMSFVAAFILIRLWKNMQRALS